MPASRSASAPAASRHRAVALETGAIVAWLGDGARSAPSSSEVLWALCNRLVEAGVGLWRVAVYVRTLHPQLLGRRFIWQAGAAEVDAATAPYTMIETEEFRTSPIARVIASGEAVRRRICDAACPLDYPVLYELRSEGATDYLATPLVFTDGAVHVASWTTQRPGGFTAAELVALESILRPLARVAEIRALRREASTLLDTYVGPNAGERILKGEIHLGQSTAIEAAIWLSDMRGFTALADRLPPEALLEHLNRYYDCQVPAIVAHGGEVLKFMGDGLLAIFPATGDEEAVCGAALAAAEAVRTAVAELPPPPGDAHRVRFGLALHLGRVLYGNIGSGDRLDFTCIGPAVNLAARLEKLAGRLGRTVIASAEFARHCGPALAPLGAFDLPGLAHAQEVYGLGAEGAGTADGPERAIGGSSGR